MICYSDQRFGWFIAAQMVVNYYQILVIVTKYWICYKLSSNYYQNLVVVNKYWISYKVFGNCYQNLVVVTKYFIGYELPTFLVIIAYTIVVSGS